MRKRRVIILAVAVVALLGGVIWLVVAGPPAVADPVYAGHPISYWVRSGDGPFNYDTNAVPYLVQALKSRDGPLRTAWNNVSGRFPDWVHRRFSSAPAWEIRICACELLGGLKAGARPAVPELVRVLREDQMFLVRANAADALGEIANQEDRPAVEALMAAATSDTNATVRGYAGDALSRLDPEAAAKTGVTNAGLRLHAR